MMIETKNPSTGESLSTYQENSAAEIEDRIKISHSVYKNWRATPIEERATLISTLSEILSKNKNRYAELITIEMGKPIVQSLAEIEKCIKACDFYAKDALVFLNQIEVNSDAAKSHIRFDALGIVLGVMPWNFPFWQVFRFALPVLLAGNTVLLKHAPNTTGCAIAIENIFKDAGFPEGTFFSILVSPERVSERIKEIIEHPFIRGVSFTGSTETGRKIASEAGKNLKRSVLELGGNDPYLILEDADLDLAAEITANSRLQNSGQSCIAAKRFIVVKKVRKEFESKLIEVFVKKKIGNPLNPETDIGPLARLDLAENIERQFAKSVEKGAKTVYRTEHIPERGFYAPLTLLSEVTKGMPAFEEETFGPLGAIIQAKDDSEAIEIANDSIYGLGTTIFTKDQIRFESLASKIEAGNCFFNAMVKSDPRLPFGGIKDSGIGKELGEFGMREFVNAKTVFIK
ncbi:MAG: NAD-dependent succinate-semialdehyde dehydrogenase [Chloroherpetonaceae bacterium]|nr:NAD-dependent succinate-semialdehyde dehydrogenase [Chloroherpetonaceae bacterium]